MSAVYQNTGDNPWIKGQNGTSQANFSTAVPRGNTVLSDAGWSAGQNWLAPNRYAAQANDAVATSQLGSWAWSAKVPAATAAGVTRFYGIPVIDGVTYLEDYGFFLDVTVTAPGAAPVLTSLTPAAGTNAGGTTVVLAGTGFTCTPALPTVLFGANAATVTSCGATSITATSPAGALGTVQVTVANGGGAASNGQTYTYTDTTAPTFNSVTAAGKSLTLTFSEAVCKVITNTWDAGDYTITVNGIPLASTGENLAVCDVATAATNGVTSYIVSVGTAFVNGDVVNVTLNAQGAAEVQDASGNLAGTQTRTAIATGDTTKPSISTAAALTSTTVKLTYSEPVRCAVGGNNAATIAQFTITSSTGTPAAQAATGTTCSTSLTGTSTITLTFLNAITTSGSVTYATGGDAVMDLAGNTATSPQTVSFAALSADTTKPLSQDIRINTSAGFAGLLDTGDVFTLAFNEVMAAPGVTSKIRLSDADGTVADVICDTVNATCALSGAALTIGSVSYPAGQVITVTMGTGPAIVTAGTTAGLAIPSSVVDSAVITDAAGNAWDIVNSPDKTLN
jgi:hypothetical protein